MRISGLLWRSFRTAQNRCKLEMKDENGERRCSSRGDEGADEVVVVGERNLARRVGIYIFP